MKRVRRLYRLEDLQFRHRLRRRKHMSLHRGIAPKAFRTHERWSMDFVHDSLIDSRAFRVLTIVDQWSRWSPILEVGSKHERRGRSRRVGSGHRTARDSSVITVEHGTEFTSRALDEWAYQRGVKLDFTCPGNPRRRATRHNAPHESIGVAIALEAADRPRLLAG